ncbi:MAG: hypothetical protein PHG06_17955 [Parabacteroides sp.]|nr:hypothetical protein [Parabacteroides sp.]
MSRKLLVFGAGGYLGGALYKGFSADNRFDTYGTFRHGESGEHKFVLDVLDTYKTAHMVRDLKPDIIIWSIANKTEELSVSEIGLRSILNNIPESTRFVYVSSTISSKQNQSEDVIPELRKPDQYLANYVNGKIVGENLVRLHPNHVIVRPGQIFGFNANNAPDIRMERILAIIERDLTFLRSDNDYISVIHIDDLADCIRGLCFSDFIGTLNVASSPPVSYYEFYKLLTKMLGLDENIIQPYKSDDPTNAYFDLTKCSSVLRTKIRSYHEILRNLKKAGG